MVEGGEDVSSPFITDGDAAEAGEPSERALDYPSVPSQVFAALDATSGDAWNDRPPTQYLPAVGEVVALVGVQLGRAAPWAACALADRRHGIDQRLQQLAVVPVGR